MGIFNRKKILSELNHYIFNYYRHPKNLNFKKDLFMQRSYQAWAASEIFNQILKDPRNPLIVVEEFKEEMDKLACSNIRDRTMFSVAYDVANDIIDYILGIEDKEYPI